MDLNISNQIRKAIMKNILVVTLVTILSGSLSLAAPVYAQSRCNHSPDINRDGIVNSIDLSILLSQYNQPAKHGNHRNADLNCDGLVNTFDLSILLSNYNKVTK